MVFQKTHFQPLNLTIEENLLCKCHSPEIRNSILSPRLHIHTCHTIRLPQLFIEHTVRTRYGAGGTAKTHPLVSDGDSERRVEIGIRHNRHQQLQLAAEGRSSEHTQSISSEGSCEEDSGVRACARAQSPGEVLLVTQAGNSTTTRGKNIQAWH